MVKCQQLRSYLHRSDYATRVDKQNVSRFLWRTAESLRHTKAIFFEVWRREIQFTAL